MASNGFEKVTQIQDSFFISEKLLHAESMYALIQAIGYIKFKVEKEFDGEYGIALRGQSRLYGDLPPSLFHGIKKQDARIKKQKNLKNLIEEMEDWAKKEYDKRPKKKYKNNLCGYLSIGADDLEPLLQHYGVKTTCLDLVDNIWVALWFSCYKAVKYANEYCNYSLYQRRDLLMTNIGQFDKGIERYLSRSSSKKFNAGMKKYQELVQRKESFCYIVMVKVPKKSNLPFQLIDLRSKYPSIYLRPHAQHGLLLKKNAKCLQENPSYADQIEGIVQMRLNSALSWLGESQTLSASMIFPSPVKDVGLQKLLRCDVLRPYLEIVTP